MKRALLVIAFVIAAGGTAAAIMFPAKCERSITAGNMVLSGCVR